MRTVVRLVHARARADQRHDRPGLTNLRRATQHRPGIQRLLAARAFGAAVRFVIVHRRDRPSLALWRRRPVAVGQSPGARGSEEAGSERLHAGAVGGLGHVRTAELRRGGGRKQAGALREGGQSSVVLDQQP